MVWSFRLVRGWVEFFYGVYKCREGGKDRVLRLGRGKRKRN